MVGSERRVKFRLLHHDGAFNYHDFVVVGRNGTAKAVDVHILTNGELASAMLRRTLLPVAVEMKKGLLERLTTEESTYVKHLPTIMKMAQFQADPKGALAVYQSLPEVLKTDKNALMFRIQAASLVDDTLYLAAMEDFRRAFPNDSSSRVMLIDYFYLKKMYKETLDQVTAIEQAEGPDAHLNVLRAGGLYELEQIEPARAELQKALALEPDLAEAVTFAIALDLATSDESAALEKIRNARELKVDLKEVEVNPAYVAFMARPDTKKKLEAADAK
jgi:tetratricopeptide (TPR) repeat protein